MKLHILFPFSDNTTGSAEKLYKELQYIFLLKILALIKRMGGERVKGLAHVQIQRASSIFWKAVWNRNISS